VQLTGGSLPFLHEPAAKPAKPLSVQSNPWSPCNSTVPEFLAGTQQTSNVPRQLELPSTTGIMSLAQLGCLFSSDPSTQLPPKSSHAPVPVPVVAAGALTTGDVGPGAAGLEGSAPHAADRTPMAHASK
jgi:hypothetical protein